jgi:hypothetical protein
MVFSCFDSPERVATDNECWKISRIRGAVAEPAEQILSPTVDITRVGDPAGVLFASGDAAKRVIPQHRDRHHP